MTSRALPLVAVAVFSLGLSGCVTEPEASQSSSSNSVASASSPSSAKGSDKSAADTRHTATPETRRSNSSGSAPAPTVAAKPAAEEPRSSWRDSQRESRTAATGNSDNAKLVEQLNEASRELATLRAANAKLRAAQPAAASQAPANSAVSAPAKSDPADDKISANLKSYAQFKQEMLGLFAEIERMRKESAGVNSNLKAAVDQADQARTAMARLESELRAEKKSRIEAEKATAQLREQLRSIAKALSSAGLNVEKFSGGGESASR